MPKLTYIELRVRYVSKLQSSGLTSLEGNRLKFKTFLAREAQPLNVPHFAGFKIPYFSIEGKPTDFYRVRYLEETKRGFSLQTDEKPLRYAQPPDTVNEVYLPPLIKWKEFIASNKPLIVTEGELKAACATKNGLPTIGLGGVWCFRSAKKSMEILPIFQQLNLEGRMIYIIFDSDAVRNHQVAAAENAFCRELIKLGAIPYIVRLPDLPNNSKTGLDDYIVNKGVTSLMSILESTKPFKAAEALYKLNEEVIYIRNPGLVFVYDDERRLSARDFTSHAFATRKYVQQTLEENGSIKLKEMSAAKEWISWPHRAEAKKITYLPGEPQLANDGSLNLWKGLAVQPEAGDISPWKELLDFLFQGEPEARSWFEQWCAYPLQNLGAKMFTAAVVWGRAQGTGKTLVGYTLMKIYGENAIEINDEDLSKGDNDYAENKQFAVGEEITGGDKRGVADRLKSLITRRTVRINVKYVPRYTITDCINYYFTSNHPDAFFLEDADRRFFVQEVTGEPLSKQFYARYDKWYGGRSGQTGPGIRALLHHLLTLDLKGFDPYAPAPMTSSKVEMIDSGRSELGSWVNLLRNDPDTVLRVDRTVLTFDLWRAEDLLALYDPENRKRATGNALARELKRAGFTKPAGYQSCKTKKGSYKLWAIRSTKGYVGLSPNKLGELYDLERDIFEQKSEKFKRKAGKDES